MRYDWKAWSREESQVPPENDDWGVWAFLGGRGAGKTRAGAEWALEQVRRGARRVALTAPTLGDVREVMIEGPSGLARIGYPHERPRYNASRRRLVWPNGAVGLAFSAEDPDSLRGPQFDAAWADEFAAWSHPQATLDMLRLGLRLGAKPRLAVTTTPRPVAALKNLLAEAGTVRTQAATRTNADNLAPGFVAAMDAAYGGSRLGRQELDGDLIEDPEGALWTRAMLDAAASPAPEDFDRVVVAVDPPASAGAEAAECGIVVAGAAGHGLGRRAFVLADASFGPAKPQEWARRVAEVYEAHRADRVYAEANQGGDMVAAVLRAACPGLPVRLVHASRGKRARAEPVSALYAGGRVRHAGRFRELEDQMCGFGAPGGGGASPDRVDALVWAITALMLEGGREPRVRGM